MTLARSAALLLMLGLGQGALGEAMAQPSPWALEKCARYRQAWAEALLRFSNAPPSPGFRADHEAFLAADCKEARRACPESAADIALANAMTKAALNLGLSGSFLPFICRG